MIPKLQGIGLAASMLVGLFVGLLVSAGPAEAGPAPQTNNSDRVALIGVPGLRWGDISAAKTPAIWRLAGQGAVANIAVRGISPRSCAAEGWLAISAGDRARPVEDGCANPPQPIREGVGAVVPGLTEMQARNSDTAYAARIGLLGDTARRAGGCTNAVGPGGALAAADSSGRVDYYSGSLPKSSDHAWKRCPITVVDVDDLARTKYDRASALVRADRRVGEALSRVPPGTVVMLVGIADVGHRGLRVAISTQLGRDGERAASYLTASSTRRSGLVTLTDVTPTVLGLAGLSPPKNMTGSAWRNGPARPAELSAAVEFLRERDLAARITQGVVAPFNIVLVGGQLVVYGLAMLLWRFVPGVRQRLPTLIGCLALAAGAVPVATYLANLVPWWRVEHPAGGLVGCVIAADLAVVLIALTGPYRRHPARPVIFIAAVTALTLAVDATVGSPLQADSLNGNFTLTAGRFYGFGNLTFALFATATLLCAAAAATYAAGAGRRGQALVTTVFIGIAAIVVVGWPGWGSDFGGVLALTPGVVLLVTRAAGRRVSPRWVLAAGGLGVLAVSGIAYLDSLRPPGRRSHLGDFWQRLLDGDAMLVVSRKADTMLHSLGNVWLTLLLPVPFLVLAFVLLRSGGLLDRLFHHAPAMRAGLPAVLVTAIAGFAVNDSGIAVPALAALIAVPLTLAAALAVRFPQRPDGTAGDPGRFPRPGSRTGH